MLADRAVADIRKRDEWVSARVNKVGASTAARFAKYESVDKYVRSLLMPQWEGNGHSQWGHQREEVILADHGYENNHICFHAEGNDRHLATPDAIRLGPEPRLAQAKTTNHSWVSKRTGEVLVPPNYRRQCWFEQYVMGPEFTETDLIYEEYETINGQFVPSIESKVIVIERDEKAIAELVRITNEVLRRLDLAAF